MDLAVYAIPAFIFFMLVEGSVAAKRQLDAYERRDTAASLTMGIGNVIIGLALKGVNVILFTFVYRFRLLELSSSSVWTWVGGFLVADFIFYWWHRMHHEVRFFWAAHEPHHSSQRYNLSTALRQSWLTPLSGLPFWWIMALMGFEPALTFTIIAINTLYQFWLHTETVDKVGPLEWFLNTPSHHRVHHGTNVQYLDRNHAGMFIIWDKLFGTFEPEVEPPIYGMTDNIDTYNPMRIAFQQFGAMIRECLEARNLGEAAGRIFAPPGWSPDGSTITAVEMRRRWEAGLAPLPSDPHEPASSPRASAPPPPTPDPDREQAVPIG